MAESVKFRSMSRDAQGRNVEVSGIVVTYEKPTVTVEAIHAEPLEHGDSMVLWALPSWDTDLTGAVVMLLDSKEVELDANNEHAWQATEGSHRIQAIVRDSLGDTAASPTVAFTVAPRPTPLFGVAAGSMSTFDALNKDIGPVLVRRSFLPPPAGAKFSGVPNTVNNTSMHYDEAEGRASMWSFKPDPVRFAAGEYDAAFKALLTSIRHHAYIGLWHEPGSEFRSGLFTPEQWHAANNRMGWMIREHGNPKLKSFICIEGRWAFTKGTQTTGGFGSFEFWHPDFEKNIDYIGFDQYSYPAAGAAGIEDLLTYQAANMTASPMGWALERKKPVLICEWGVSDKWGAEGKADRIWNFWVWAKRQAAIGAVCYFHNNHDVIREPEFTWETAPGTGARAMLRTIAAESRAAG